MNDNFYQWHGDFPVLLEMREVQQVPDQNRMLKEAGILGAGWLVHGVEPWPRGLQRLDTRRMM